MMVAMLFTTAMAISMFLFVESYSVMMDDQYVARSKASAKYFDDYLKERELDSCSFTIYRTMGHGLSKDDRILRGQFGDFIIFKKAVHDDRPENSYYIIGFFAVDRAQGDELDIFSFECVVSHQPGHTLESQINQAIAQSPSEMAFHSVKRIGEKGIFASSMDGSRFRLNAASVAPGELPATIALGH